MKQISLWVKILFVTLVIAIGSLVWAWAIGPSAATISRGFFVGGVLALIFGLGNFATSYSFTDQNAPSYSTAYYNTLKQRSQLMMKDMEEHSSFSLLLLGGGILSLIIGFLIFRFG
jgi:hypothetical protein